MEQEIYFNMTIEERMELITMANFINRMEIRYKKSIDDLYPSEWMAISYSKIPIPAYFLEKYKDKLNWFGICRNQKFNDAKIRKFFDYLDLDAIGIIQTLSEEIIREYIDVFDWDDITTTQTLSEDIIREAYYNSGDILSPKAWRNISRYQKLSENFIEEFSDKGIEWRFISTHQILSDEFINKHKDKITFDRPSITVREGFSSRNLSDYVIYNKSNIEKTKCKTLTWNEVLKIADICGLTRILLTIGKKGRIR